MTKLTALLLLAPLLSAQSDRGTITGTVQDPAGAVVPGAVVRKNFIRAARAGLVTCDPGRSMSSPVSFLAAVHCLRPLSLVVDLIRSVALAALLGRLLCKLGVAAISAAVAVSISRLIRRPTQPARSPEASLGAHPTCLF